MLAFELAAIFKFAAFLLTFYLPGALIYDAFSKIKAPERLFIEISTSMMISGIAGMILAQFGVFSLELLTMINATICIFLLAKYPVLFPARKAAAITAIIIAAFLISFAIPREEFLGGIDPGVHLSTGVNIAKTGALNIQYGTVSELSGVNSSFYPTKEKPSLGTTGIEFPGFYITNPQTGSITPQFFHLYSIWIAIFYSLFGLQGTLYVTILFYLLSLCTIFFFTKRLFSTQAAIIATALLAVNFAQIWYALNANSEITMQAFMFLTLYFLYQYTNENDPLSGFLAVLAIGNGLLTRIEFSFIVPLIIAFIVYAWMQKNIDIRAFLLPFALLLAHSVWTALSFSKPYTLINFVGILGNLQNWNFRHTILLPVWTFLLAISVWFFLTGRAKTLFTPRRRLYAALTIWLIFVIFYFFSPYILANQADNFVQLSYYLTPLGYFTGLLGILLMFWNKDENHWLLIAVFTAYFSLFGFEAIISQRHPWWARRFLPVIIPTLIIGISYFLTESKIIRNSILRKSTAVAFTLALGVLFSITTAHVFMNNEHEGVTNTLSEISNAIIEPAIVLYSTDGISLRYATPLRYIYGKKTVHVKKADTTVLEYIANMSKQNNVYILIPTHSTFSEAFDLRPAYQKTISWTTISRQRRWKSQLKGLFYLPYEPSTETHKIVLYKVYDKDFLQTTTINQWKYYS